MRASWIRRDIAGMELRTPIPRCGRERCGNSGGFLGTVELLGPPVRLMNGRFPFQATVDWGDGSPIEPTISRVSSAGAQPARDSLHATIKLGGQHTYARPGDYAATVLVTNSDGDTSQTTTTFHIKPEILTLWPATLSATAGVASGFVVASGTDTVADLRPQVHHWTCPTAPSTGATARRRLGLISGLRPRSRGSRRWPTEVKRSWICSARHTYAQSGSIRRPRHADGR